MRLGSHAIFDGYGVDPEILDDTNLIKHVVEWACREHGCTVLEAISHKFAPQGTTVILLLAESHAAVHTYPEHGRCSIDVYMCGDRNPEPAAQHIAAVLGGTWDSRVLTRGS